MITDKIGNNIFCQCVSEYVMQHWKDDDFFGFQFLNAINPNVIKRCSELPPNFSITEEMVKPFLRDGTSLKQEMGVWMKRSFKICCLQLTSELLFSVVCSERKYLHLWPEDHGWNTHQDVWWSPSASGSWLVFVLHEPREQTDANCNTGILLREQMAFILWALLCCAVMTCVWSHWYHYAFKL